MTSTSVHSGAANQFNPGYMSPIAANYLALFPNRVSIREVHDLPSSFETISPARVIHRNRAFDPGEPRDSESQHGVYLICIAGICYRGSWPDVVGWAATDSWTSSQVIPVEDTEGDRRPESVPAARVRQLKAESGLTWDQVSRLFGVSRRAVHLWAAGARMNFRHEELLTYLEQVIDTIDTADPASNRATLMSPSTAGGHSLFQRLVMRSNPIGPSDIESRTESTGAGPTVHGEFLFADSPDRPKVSR